MWNQNIENHGMLQFLTQHWTWAIPSPSSACAHFHGLLLGCFVSFSHQEKCWDKKKRSEGAKRVTFILLL